MARTRRRGDWERLERRGADSELNADEILRLTLMKRIAGRPQDINDLAQLEDIRGDRG